MEFKYYKTKTDKNRAKRRRKAITKCVKRRNKAVDYYYQFAARMQRKNIKE